MRVRIIILALPLLLAALLLGIFLAPNGKEVALMQYGASDSQESLRTYTALHSQGDNSVSVLAPLINLHLYYGDVEKAMNLLEIFVAENPNNIEGRKRLAGLYKASQRYYDYCNILEEEQDLSHSPEVLRNLIDTYDFLGEYKKEREALARLVGHSGDKVLEEDYVKLAKFYRIEGNPSSAAEILDRLLDKKDYQVGLDTVYLASQILLENGNEAKAFMVATKSLKNHPVEENALKLSELFQLNDKIDLAYEILGPFLAQVENSPQLEQQMIGLLFAKKKTDDIFAILSGQFAKNKLPKTLAEPLIDLAQERKDYALMEAVLRSADLNEISAQALLRYTDLSIRQRNRSLAQTIERRIEVDRLKTDEPLLAAMLKVAAGEKKESISALLALPTDIVTLPEEKLMVARAFLMYGQEKRARDVIDELPVPDVVDSLDPLDYALLYLEDPGSAANVEERLKAINVGDLRPESRGKVDLALLFIETGLGQTDAVDLWFKRHPVQASLVYNDAYSLASRFRQEKASLNIAQRLYQVDPSNGNREQLVDALLLNRRFADVLTYVQSDFGKNPKVKISTYIDLLSQWAQNIKKAGENTAQIQPYIEFAVKHIEHDGKEQQELAELLQGMGMRLEAEGLLVALATGKPFASSSVQEVLSFWGRKPSSAAVTWIKTRASTATDFERAQWLSYLNEINRPEAVIEMVQNQIENAPLSVIDIYIAALISVRSPKLSEVLSHEIESETDVERLKRLVQLAEQENFRGVADKGWHKVFALDPNDSDALKVIALQEAGANHYAAALPLLKRALKANPNDYQINYAYAGILQHQQKKSEAVPFYDKAFAQLSEVKEKTLDDRLSMAHLLYRSKGLTESADLFRELIKEYPDNKSLRADFAEILLENKQYDEASVILSP